ncbi:thiol:disulfide interchange protein DsbA/DsbL [Ferrimonas sediminicola]|uniref:Thiol:disulfide interchange protein n=1 Tax=Ferrimonas sediminicola TaxID=2569538 RepID=A0A4U1BDW0_9GAMM|nr:thiol:disulfide interchange protein DsbA/DsbL [Ferrimonas sediminicola]TKB49222.1 thiol:disulfide interchange protein DsbA/DsbL [Ferrimonas sediminicola]
MKRILSLAAASLLALTAHAADYSEGKHYIDLKENGFSATNKVVKVYSTNCPFCYKYEKAVMPKFVKNLPEGVTYEAYHISTKPPFGKEKATVVAVAKTLGEKQYKKAKMAYYKHIHDDKVKFKSSEEATQFGLESANIDQATFDRLKDSPEVTSLMAKWDQGIKVAKIKGIPAIVVNGRFLINTQSITSMKMLDELTAELLTK